jgi:hypothetical protein
MMIEAIGRAMQAERERSIREALRARAMLEGRQAPPEPVSPLRSRHPGRAATPTYAGSATTP